MRTNITGMEGSDDEGEPPEGGVQEEGYRLQSGEGWKYVIFDPENPLAYILSDWFGTPPDRQPEDEDGEDQETS